MQRLKVAIEHTGLACIAGRGGKGGGAGGMDTLHRSWTYGG